MTNTSQSNDNKNIDEFKSNKYMATCLINDIHNFKKCLIVNCLCCDDFLQLFTKDCKWIDDLLSYFIARNQKASYFNHFDQDRFIDSLDFSNQLLRITPLNKVETIDLLN
jgi:hypothetical protein